VKKDEIQLRKDHDTLNDKKTDLINYMKEMYIYKPLIYHDR